MVETSKKLFIAAVNILAKRYKIKNFTVIDVDQDTVPSSGELLFRCHAVAEDAPNGPRYTVVLDCTGAETDLEELSRREGKRFFAAVDPVVDVLQPPVLPAVSPALITISPTENVLTFNTGDTHTEVITVKVPKSAGTAKADVYFLADTTGSMGTILNAVKAGANNILSALNGLSVDFAFGVGNYKDFQRPQSDPYAFQHQQNLTNSSPAITNAINAWTAQGGVDGPEGEFFAFHKLAEPPGGPIGWRSGSKRIIVWFGDQPGHDPICAAISGEPVPITEASVTAKLVSEGIVVLAISVGAPGLDVDPLPSSFDYNAVCGPPGGSAGQATRIANATGGQFVSGINAGNIVNTIITLVTSAVGSINNLKLVPTGGAAPFVVSITPATGYGPLSGDKEHELRFDVVFKGVVPCTDEDQVFTGTIDVVADGVVVASKRVRITVPACRKDRFSYSVKFICGEQRECACECVSVRPGIYATEINIHNYHDADVKIEKFVTPVVFAGVPVGREPKVAARKASDQIVLPPHTATMDDCCRIAGLLFGGKPPSPIPLTIGFLEISSSHELAVTAVYTVSDSKSGSVSIDVEQLDAVKVKQG